MAAILNAAPNALNNGFKDESGRALVPEKQAVPQHCPIFYIMSERGKLVPQLTSGGPMLRSYGASTFGDRSKYFSHQTLGAKICNGNGNKIFLKRVVPADSSAGSLVFFLEVVEDTLAAYVRNADGSVVRDASGVKTLSPTATNLGYRLKWSVAPLSDITNLRGELNVTGTLTGAGGQTSTVYPMFAMKGGIGDYINNTGMRFSFPGPTTAAPTDLAVMEENGAVVYRMEWMERDTATSTPRTLFSIAKEANVDFCLKAGVVNSKTDVEYNFEKVLTEYTHSEPDGTPPIDGPMDELYVYQDNVDAVLALIQTQEVTHNAAIVEADLVNIMNVLDIDGNDHYAARMDATSISMNASTTHYVQGGKDGTVNEATLNLLVKDECLHQWDNVNAPLVDDAQFPISVVYDTGFEMATKQAILGTMAMRDDISIGACTQTVGEKDNTSGEDSSIMAVLRSTARLTPESTFYGTPTCRAVVYGGVGTFKTSKYGKRVPTIMDIINKRSKYMGASNGVMNNVYAYDVFPANVLDTMKDVSNGWKPKSVISADWELGMNAPRYADMSQLFWPAQQTVYDNDTSVLNSDITMLIMVDVLKKSYTVHRRLTGNGTMEDGAFLAASDTLMSELVEGIYDGRVQVKPKAEYTKADEARGYSWTQNNRVYAKGMKTVSTVNVIAKRYSDL